MPRYTTSGYRNTVTQSEREARRRGRLRTAGISEEDLEYKSPEYNLGKVSALTQEQLAPAIAEGRRSLRDIQAGRYVNPIARREAIRGAIEAKGTNLARQQATAARTASTLYAPEYQAEVNEAMERYRSALRESDLLRREDEAGQRRGGSAGGQTYASAQRNLEALMAGARVAPSSTKRIPTQRFTNDLYAGTKRGGGRGRGSRVRPSALPAIYSPDELLTESFARA